MPESPKETFRVGELLVAQLDELAEQGRYQSRSDALRVGVRRVINARDGDMVPMEDPGVPSSGDTTRVTVRLSEWLREEVGACVEAGCFDSGSGVLRAGAHSVVCAEEDGDVDQEARADINGGVRV